MNFITFKENPTTHPSHGQPSQRRRLQSTQGQQIEEGPFLCSSCGKAFRTDSELLAHSPSCSTIKDKNCTKVATEQFMCSYKSCSKPGPYKKEDQVRAHISNTHLRDRLMAAYKERVGAHGKRERTCRLCVQHREFTTPTHLCRHLAKKEHGLLSEEEFKIYIIKAAK